MDLIREFSTSTYSRTSRQSPPWGQKKSGHCEVAEEVAVMGSGGVGSGGGGGGGGGGV